MTSTTVVMELCHSNSIGSRFVTPTVVSWRETSREEADVLLDTKLENGFYWREMPADRTGN